MSPEEPFEDGITMTETLKLVRELVEKPLQYNQISQKDYFKKSRRGEGTGIERLKLIHDITKGKVSLIGVGGLKSEKDLIKAESTGFTELFAVGAATMINRDFGILLKEGKGNKINLEFEPEHPEICPMPKKLWEMCLTGQEWFPPIKGKTKAKSVN